MSDIVLSSGVRQNLLSLQRTADLMSTTQNRLATGKKVNSALDNPTNFFTSAALQSRAGDSMRCLNSMSVGIKTLQAADNGISAITKTIESMQSTLRQARQDKSFQTASYGDTVRPIAGVTSNATAKTVSFSGGSVGSTPVAVTVDDLARIGQQLHLDIAATATDGVRRGDQFDAITHDDRGRHRRDIRSRSRSTPP